MECVGCGSGAVTERPDLTAQGYRRFWCRDCDKQFNERSDGGLNRASLPSDIIAFVVFCRLSRCVKSALHEVGPSTRRKD
jgi:transposase-like protein